MTREITEGSNFQEYNYSSYQKSMYSTGQSKKLQKEAIFKNITRIQGKARKRHSSKVLAELALYNSLLRRVTD